MQEGGWGARGQGEYLKIQKSRATPWQMATAVTIFLERTMVRLSMHCMWEMF